MELKVPNRVAKTSLGESNDSSHFDECFNPIIVKTTILFITIKSLGNGRFEKLIIIYRCPWKALPLYQTQTAWLEFFIHLLEDIFRCFCKLQWHPPKSCRREGSFRLCLIKAQIWQHTSSGTVRTQLQVLKSMSPNPIEFENAGNMTLFESQIGRFNWWFYTL